MPTRLAATLVLAVLLAIAGPLAPAALATDLPLAGVTIALDPGHNGGNASHPDLISRRIWIGTAWKRCNSVGTHTLSGYSEHRFNFSVAGKVKARLEALGATVYMTRYSDTGVGPCIDVRGKLGAKVGARLLVSIHADGAPSADRGWFICRPGTITGWTDDIAAASLTLARAIRTGLRSTGLPQANYYTSTGIKTRTDLGTLNYSDVPAVLVELGNMRNATDAARMQASTGRDRYARGIVAGIRVYLGR